jgi:membrane fusion protein, copper/silver efflux system
MGKRWLYIVWLLILAIACGKQTQENHAHHSGDTNKVAIGLIARPANQVVISAQKTIRPSRGLTDKTITANGYIVFDERRNNKVAVRISGRIEKLYVRYNYQYVKKGQPIAELYSPELSTYQEEYLLLLNSAEDSLVEKAEEKLRLLGLSENQIHQIRKSGFVTRTISVTSSHDGFIRFSSDPVSQEGTKSSSASMSQMNGAASKDAGNGTTSSVRITEGMYVNKGQTLFVVNDCRKVWAILSANIASQAEIKKGDSVIFYSEVQPEQIKAMVDFVEPIYEETQRFTQVRVYLDNPLRTFKINSLIKGEFSTRTNTITIPASSVYDLGTRKIVWVKTGATASGTGLFEAREVNIGFSVNNVTEILNGLTGNEDIALDAGYLLDRESIVNEKP